MRLIFEFDTEQQKDKLHLNMMMHAEAAFNVLREIDSFFDKKEGSQLTEITYSKILQRHLENFDYNNTQTQNEE